MDKVIEFKRRNAFSDKVISFIGMMLMIILFYNVIQVKNETGTIILFDFLTALIGLGIGILFLYTSRFTYLEFNEDKITWRTWFFVKHTLTKAEIKDITTKKRYYIISRHKGSDIWISKLYIRTEDEEVVNEKMKKLIEG
ncbi:MAG: hypothetical protein ACRCSG_02900 [Cellulosilyticaceae bacterium]